MDLILFSNIVHTAFPVLIFSFAISGIVIFVISGLKEDFDWVPESKGKIVFMYVVIFILMMFSFIPRILITTNKDRIRLRYTDIKMVEKVENRALQMLDKVETLVEDKIKKEVEND